MITLGVVNHSPFASCQVWNMQSRAARRGLLSSDSTFRSPPHSGSQPARWTTTASSLRPGHSKSTEFALNLLVFCNVAMLMRAALPPHRTSSRIPAAARDPSGIRGFASLAGVPCLPSSHGNRRVIGRTAKRRSPPAVPVRGLSSANFSISSDAAPALERRPSVWRDWPGRCRAQSAMRCLPCCLRSLQRQWAAVADRVGISRSIGDRESKLRAVYTTFLQSFDARLCVISHPAQPHGRCGSAEEHRARSGQLGAQQRSERNLPAEARRLPCPAIPSQFAQEFGFKMGKPYSLRTYRIMAAEFQQVLSQYRRVHGSNAPPRRRGV